MKKGLLLIVILLLVPTQLFALETDNIEAKPFKTMADMSASEGKYEEAISEYYASYLHNEVSRQIAYEKINNCRTNIKDYEPKYQGMTKGNKFPNVLVRPIDLNINYDIFLVVIKNNSNQKMTLNGMMTKGIAVNSQNSQVKALTVFDTNSNKIPDKVFKKMLSDDTIYLGASFDFVFVFPKNEDYKGMYIDSIYYEDHSKEEIYIDFFNYE